MCVSFVWCLSLDNKIGGVHGDVLSECLKWEKEGGRKRELKKISSSHGTPTYYDWATQSKFKYVTFTSDNNDDWIIDVA